MAVVEALKRRVHGKSFFRFTDEYFRSTPNGSGLAVMERLMVQ